MSVPENCRYTKEHEWARLEPSGVIVVGVTNYAQQALGDVVYVELPEPGEEVTREETFGVVESTKSVSDLIAPVSGTVDARNDIAVDTPEVCNEDPYEDGWLIRIKATDRSEYDELLSSDEYEEFLGTLG